MNCPIPHELLVRYWAGDATDEEIDAVDEHLFGCATCFEASSRVAALAQGLSEAIPPVVVGRDIALAEARGVHKAVNDFQPGVPHEAWLHEGTDLLVHRLVGDFHDAEKVAVDIRLPDGSRLLSFAEVPFDPAEGAVSIACQRHFIEGFGKISMDIDVVVHRTLRGGGEASDTYSVQHRIG